MKWWSLLISEANPVESLQFADLQSHHFIVLPVTNQFVRESLWKVFHCLGVSEWWYPQIIHFNRDFHYKPSILGYPYFRKHPFSEGNIMNHQPTILQPPQSSHQLVIQSQSTINHSSSQIPLYLSSSQILLEVSDFRKSIWFGHGIALQKKMTHFRHTGGTITKKKRYGKNPEGPKEFRSLY